MQRISYSTKIEEMNSQGLNRLEAGSVLQVECIGDIVGPMSKRLYLVEYQPQVNKVEPQVEIKLSEKDGSVVGRIIREVVKDEVNRYMRIDNIVQIIANLPREALDAVKSVLRFVEQQ